MSGLDEIARTDPDIAQVIRDELYRLRHKIELIASENFPSRAVLETAGTVLTNKYAEGYPATGGTAAASSWTSQRSSP